MRKVSKIKIRPKALKLFKIVGIFLVVYIAVFCFFAKQINDLKRLDYSKKASEKILFTFKKKYVLSVGKNKTLNKAFESKEYKEVYLDNYRKINYYDFKDLIKYINLLIEKGYSNNDINIILAHGDDKSITDFIKRDKVKYLEEFFTVSYAKLENYDRYVSYSDLTGEDDKTTVLFVNLDLDKEDYSDANEIDKFSLDMLVNKHNYLKKDFVPNNLVKISSVDTKLDECYANEVAYNAYKKMSSDAEKEGYKLIINSAYRSFQDQVKLVDSYTKQYGEDYVIKYVAKEGYSEHQTGLAFDIGSRRVDVFANSKEYLWMQENAYKYGFIHRFTKKWENITGFRNEPWHYRYVGVEIATYIYEHNISFEEYWVLFLEK